MKTNGGAEVYLLYSWPQHKIEGSGQLHARGKSPSYSLDKGLDGPQIRLSGRCGPEKNLFYLKYNPVRPARNPPLYRLSYRGSITTKTSVSKCWSPLCCSFTVWNYDCTIFLNETQCTGISLRLLTTLMLLSTCSFLCLEEILQITTHHRMFIAVINKPYPEILRDKYIS
jgi:hypothetical protein